MIKLTPVSYSQLVLFVLYNTLMKIYMAQIRILHLKYCFNVNSRTQYAIRVLCFQAPDLSTSHICPPLIGGWKQLMRIALIGDSIARVVEKCYVDDCRKLSLKLFNPLTTSKRGRENQISIKSVLLTVQYQQKHSCSKIASLIKNIKVHD